jgi:hypothetical protein
MGARCGSARALLAVERAGQGPAYCWPVVPDLLSVLGVASSVLGGVLLELLLVLVDGVVVVVVVVVFDVDEECDAPWSASMAELAGCDV